MDINIYPTKKKTSEAAAEKAVSILNDAIAQKGEATFIMATGASQFDFLEALVNSDEVDWSKTKMFHLDEYIGLPETHPASFRKYLKERFINRVEGPEEVNLLQGDAEDAQKECDRVGELISSEKVDVAFVGIGENGHLAFNDPPADFEVEDPYIVVDLDQACREQQLGEGWFKTLDDVPEKAISMSIKQIMKSEQIICTVPGKRKAQAVKDCFSGDSEVSPEAPASILKEHENTNVYLDKESASMLDS